MFDKHRFKLVIERAIGGETNAEFARKSGVNRTYLSKYMNEGLDKPPSPDILKMIADKSHNDVTYEELMKAAGYILDNEQLLDDISRCGLKVSEIAKVVDIPTDTLYKILNSESVEMPPFIKLCNWLGYDAENAKQLYSNQNKNNQYTINPLTKIPVLGVIRAGEPLLAQQNIISYDYLPNDMVKGGNYFGLKVTGDSMNNAQILDGNIVIVREQPCVNDGEIAVVLVDGENATIKRFYQTNTTVTLVPQSNNPEHMPRIIDTAKTEVKVLGKVVKVVINL